MWGAIHNKWSKNTKQSDKHNDMLNVAANLKHVETHEKNNWSLVSIVDWTTDEACLFVVFLLRC